MNEKALVKSYKDLLVWQEGIQWVKQAYLLTKDFPADEKFGLVSQMRRAAVSAPSNIAEGQARRSTAEFIQFLSVAEGSLAELETQLIVCVELGFCSQVKVVELFGSIHQLRNKLATSH